MVIYRECNVKVTYTHSLDWFRLVCSMRESLATLMNPGYCFKTDDLVATQLYQNAALYVTINESKTHGNIPPKA